MLEFAAQQRPRGSIEKFDAVAASDALGWPADFVRRIVHAMMVIGLHDFTKLRAWDKRNPPDSTAAERQRNRRRRNGKSGSNRHTVTVSPVSERHAVTDDSHTVTVSSVSERHAVTDDRHTVTPKALSSFFSSSSSAICKSAIPPSGDARAREEKLSTDSIWAALAAIGIRPGMFGRFGSGSSIANWVDRGLTAGDLAEAIERARRVRERDGDPSPLNLRFVACFIEDVLAGVPERAKTQSWIERGDAIGRAFVEERG